MWRCHRDADGGRMTDSDDDGGSLQHSFIYLQSRTNPVGRTANRVLVVGRRTHLSFSPSE
eukprot:scaffold27689_cov100-Isochrysis_galbana.AAC.4